MSGEVSNPASRDDRIGWPVWLGAIVIVGAFAFLGYELLDTFADLLRKLP